MPSFFAARGAVIFEYGTDGERVVGEARIYLRGANGISRFAMMIVSGTLLRHIDHRFRSNMENVRKLAYGIVNEPDSIKEKLSGPLLDDFIRSFR